MTTAGACAGPEPLRDLRTAEIPKAQEAGSRAVCPEAGLRLQKSPAVRPEAGPCLQKSPAVRPEAGPRLRESPAGRPEAVRLPEEERRLTDVPKNKGKAGPAVPGEAEADQARADRPKGPNPGGSFCW